jgi:hypothetical protein
MVFSWSWYSLLLATSRLTMTRQGIEMSTWTAQVIPWSEIRSMEVDPSAGWNDLSGIRFVLGGRSRSSWAPAHAQWWMPDREFDQRVLAVQPSAERLGGPIIW